MAKNKSRKQSRRRVKKQRGGVNEVAPAMPAEPVAPVEAVPPAAPAAPSGGKRKTRKVSKGASDWNKKVMEVYHEMKKKNPDTKLGDAMRECSKRKKRGDF